MEQKTCQVHVVSVNRDLDGHLIEVGEDMKMVLRCFLASGMTMEEVSVKMDASIEDLTKLLNT